MKMAKQEGYIHIPCNRMHNWRPPSLSELTPLLNIIGVNSLRPEDLKLACKCSILVDHICIISQRSYNTH